jgi:DegV family protein with EDD domain
MQLLPAFPVEKTKIIVDSTADFPPGYKHPDITIVPVIIKYRGEEWDEFEFNKQRPDFFKEKPDAFIQTSQPAPGTFINYYTETLREGYNRIVVLTLTSKLSGVYNSACIAATQLLEEGKIRENQVFVVDSKTVSAALAMLAMQAADYSKSHSAEETAQHLKQQAEKTRVYGGLSNLKHVMASGRLGPVAERVPQLGALIKLHFLLSLKDGEICSPEKLPIRKFSDALEKVIGFIREEGVTTLNAALLHADDASKTSALEEKLRQNFNIGSLYTAEVNKALRGHTGPTLWGLAYLLD